MCQRILTLCVLSRQFWAKKTYFAKLKTLGSQDDDVIGTAGGLLASHSMPEVKWVIPKFWVQGSSVKSQNISTSQKSLIRGRSHVRGAFLPSIAPITRLRCPRSAIMTARAVVAVAMKLPKCRAREEKASLSGNAAVSQRHPEDITQVLRKPVAQTWLLSLFLLLIEQDRGVSAGQVCVCTYLSCLTILYSFHVLWKSKLPSSLC